MSAIQEKLIDLEARMTNLSNRAHSVGVLTERKRIADFIAAEYQSAFAVNSAMAPELLKILNYVYERENA